MKHHLIALCLVSILIGNACAKTYTEKTFLRTPHNYYFKSISKNRIPRNGSVQITSFYRKDQNKKEIGQYFGRNESNIIKIGKDNTDFSSANLIFANDPDSTILKGDLELLPYRKIKGLNFDYLQRLYFVSNKLFLNVNLPVIHISRDMNTKVYNETKQIVEGKKVGIEDYFIGGIEQKNDPQKQEPLKYAKIKCDGGDSKSGAGDVEATLGYQFNKNNQSFLRCSVGAVIPTSDAPDGEYLFEPMLGNGGRFGFIASIEAMTVLYESYNAKIDVNYALSFKHFLQNSQKRTISFKSDDMDSKRSWAHYYGFLGQAGKKGVFPGANVLTRDVSVFQGLVLDFVVNYNISFENLLLCVGYNFFSQAAEKVRVKDWPNDTYAIASPNYDTSQNFVISPDPDLAPRHNIETAIQENMLDTSVAENPASVNHKVYFLISAKSDSVRLPVTLGIGGAYQFAQDNSSFQGYELMLRVGASF